MSTHYLIKIAQVFHFIFSCVSSTSSLYRRVAEASCCDMGGNIFSRVWWTMQLISSKKDWKHVFVQKVVTLNICCNIACLTFHLPHITTGSFHSHQYQPTTGFFSEPPTPVGMHIPSVMWKCCAFYKVVWWHFSGVVAEGVTVCFLLW